MVTGSRFSGVLKKLHSVQDYWIDDWYDPSQGTLNNWDGQQDFRQVTDSYPCLLLRGRRLRSLDHYLRKEELNIVYNSTCSAGVERIATVGVDCKEGWIP